MSASDALTRKEFNFIRYFPDILLSDYINKSQQLSAPPEVFNFKSLVLTTNIIGFQNINDHFQNSFQDGLEQASDILKDVFGHLQAILGSTGADIIPYMTDRFVFIWPLSQTENEQSLSNIIRTSIFQILSMRQVLAARSESEGVPLKMNFIMTLDDVDYLLLGGPQKMESVIGGPAFLQALEYHNLEKPDFEIVITEQVRHYIQDEPHIEMIKFTPRDEPKMARFFEITGIRRVPDLAHTGTVDPLFFKKTISKEQYERIHASLTSYLPMCVREQIDEGIEEWSNEIRKLTVVSVNVPVDPFHNDTQKIILLMNQIIFRVQEIATLNKGFIYRPFLDHTGLNLFIIYGAFPGKNQDDASVGVLSASALVREIMNRFELEISVGVATGHALITTGGNYRKDFMIIGHPVGSSYLLMIAALKDKTKAMLVDYQTRFESENKVTYKTYKQRQSTFEPMFTKEVFNPNPLNQFPKIKTHRFNVDPYLKNPTKKDFQDSIYQLGREQDFHLAMDMISKFVRTPVKANLLLIGGGFGIGKSLFARNLLECSSEKFIPRNEQNPYGPIILTSSMNPLTRTVKLNGWKSIFREILDMMSYRMNLETNYMLNQTFKNYKDLHPNVDKLREVLGLNEDEHSVEESIIVTKPVSYQKSLRQTLATMLVILLKRFTGEGSFANEQVANPNYPMGMGKTPNQRGPPPLIICLDDLQDHDKLSWEVTNEALLKLKKVFIIGCIRNEDNEISPKKADIADQALMHIANNDGIIADKIILGGLHHNHIEKLIRKVLNGRDLDPKLRAFIAEMSSGNPLVALELTNNLIRQELIHLNDIKIMPDKAIQKFIRIDQYIEILTPDSRNKVIGHMLDNIPLMGYLILKLASVIGALFDLKQLMTINPFHGSLLPPETLLTILQKLCQLKILAVVDDSSRNIIFRFTAPFVRELTYQRLPYFIRGQLHRRVAESLAGAAMKSATTAMMRKEDEEEQLLYHWHLSNIDKESEERAFIIKKINQELDAARDQKKPGTILKEGPIVKLSRKDANKWQVRYLVLTPHCLKIYNNEKDPQDAPILEKCSIDLFDVFSLRVIVRNLDMVGSTQGKMTKPGLAIAVGRWAKAGVEQGPREFIIAFDKEREMLSWRDAIDHVRAKGTFDSFVAGFDPRSIDWGIQNVRSRTQNGNLSINIEESPKGSPRGKTVHFGDAQYPMEQSKNPYFNYKPQGGQGSLDKSLNHIRGRDQARPSWELEKPLKALGGNKGQFGGNNYGNQLGGNRYRDYSPKGGDSQPMMAEYSPTHRDQRRMMVESLLNKGQIMTWSNLFESPFSFADAQGAGRKSQVLHQNPGLLDVKFPYSEKQMNVRPKIHRLPEHIEKKIRESANRPSVQQPRGNIDKGSQWYKADHHRHLDHGGSKSGQISPRAAHYAGFDYTDVFTPEQKMLRAKKPYERHVIDLTKLYPKGQGDELSEKYVKPENYQGRPASYTPTARTTRGTQRYFPAVNGSRFSPSGRDLSNEKFFSRVQWGTVDNEISSDPNSRSGSPKDKNSGEYRLYESSPTRNRQSNFHDIHNPVETFGSDDGGDSYKFTISPHADGRKFNFDAIANQGLNYQKSQKLNIKSSQHSFNPVQSFGAPKNKNNDGDLYPANYSGQHQQKPYQLSDHGSNKGTRDNRFDDNYDKYASTNQYYRDMSPLGEVSPPRPIHEMHVKAAFKNSSTSSPANNERSPYHSGQKVQLKEIASTRVPTTTAKKSQYQEVSSNEKYYPDYTPEEKTRRPSPVNYKRARFGPDGKRIDSPERRSPPPIYDQSFERDEQFNQEKVEYERVVRSNISPIPSNKTSIKPAESRGTLNYSPDRPSVIGPSPDFDYPKSKEPRGLYGRGCRSDIPDHPVKSQRPDRLSPTNRSYSPGANRLSPVNRNYSPGTRGTNYSINMSKSATGYQGSENTKQVRSQKPIIHTYDESRSYSIFEGSNNVSRSFENDYSRVVGHDIPETLVTNKVPLTRASNLVEDASHITYEQHQDRMSKFFKSRGFIGLPTYVGLCLATSKSIEGDLLSVSKDEIVVIEAILEDRQLVKVVHKAKAGLFPKMNFKIVPSNDKRASVLVGNLITTDFISKTIPSSINVNISPRYNNSTRNNDTQQTFEDNLSYTNNSNNDNFHTIHSSNSNKSVKESLSQVSNLKFEYVPSPGVRKDDTKFLKKASNAHSSALGIGSRPSDNRLNTITESKSSHDIWDGQDKRRSQDSKGSGNGMSKVEMRKQEKLEKGELVSKNSVFSKHSDY